MTETSKKLIQQVEKILDEGEGEERSVIVQMTSPDEKKKDLMVRTASLVREAALAVAELWTSRSAVLKMKRDDLKRLPDEVPQIRDIHPNRILRTPPLVEVKNLPTAILENKASSWGGTCNWRLGGLGGVRHTRSRYHDRIVGYRRGS